MHAFARSALYAAFLFAPAASAAEPHWDYRGPDDPAHWGEHYAECARGRHQSPVDLAATHPGQHWQVQFHYRPSALDVANNGHTVLAPLKGAGSITVGGEEYAFQQVHFHAPSEHTVRHHHFPMEAHLVHQNARGELAVVAVMLQPGAPNPFVERLLGHLPVRADGEHHYDETMDLRALLPRAPRYYSYEGSLTTPPCTEGVKWVVLEEPVSVSPRQIDAFTRLYPHNARPEQPLNGRDLRAL